MKTRILKGLIHFAIGTFCLCVAITLTALALVMTVTVAMLIR